MDAKLPARFWDDTAGLPLEVKLTAVWAISECDISGLFRVVPRRFSFSTGIDEKWLTRSLTSAENLFSVENDLGLFKLHIIYEFGSGDRLLRNPHMFTSFCKGFLGLPKGLRRATLALHPELKPHVEAKLLQFYQHHQLKPSKGLPKPSQALETPMNPLLSEAVSTSDSSLPGRATLGLGRALVRERERECEREESCTGECEGGNPPEPPDPSCGDPTLAEVIARSAPIGITTEEATRFFEHYDGLGWMLGRTRMAKWWQWLPKWKAKAQEFAAQRQGSATGPASNHAAIAAIDEKLRYTQDPVKREALEKKRAALEKK